MRKNESNRTFRSYHDYGQGPPCSDKGRCRCALSTLNIALWNTLVKAFSSGLSQPATEDSEAARGTMRMRGGDHAWFLSPCTELFGVRLCLRCVVLCCRLKACSHLHPRGEGMLPCGCTISLQSPPSLTVLSDCFVLFFLLSFYSIPYLRITRVYCCCCFLLSFFVFSLYIQTY